MHRVLKHALEQAVKWQLLPRNPADAVDPPKVERQAMQTYDMAQTAALIEAMRETRLHIPTVLAVLCGLRRGEIAALRWRNVDLPRPACCCRRAPSRLTLAFATRNPSRAGRAPSPYPPR